MVRYEFNVGSLPQPMAPILPALSPEAPQATSQGYVTSVLTEVVRGRDAGNPTPDDQDVCLVQSLTLFEEHSNGWPRLPAHGRSLLQNLAIVRGVILSFSGDS